MMTVREVSRLTGVSVRTLHHYDRIGLLKPSSVSAAGYRLYDGAALERLEYILLLRALEFPLKAIPAKPKGSIRDRRTVLPQTSPVHFTYRISSGSASSSITGSSIASGKRFHRPICPSHFPSGMRWPEVII